MKLDGECGQSARFVQIEIPPITSDTGKVGRRLPPHLDPLTQVLEGVRLRCMLPGAHEMTVPWGIRLGGATPTEMRRHAESLGATLPKRDMPRFRGSIIAVISGHCCLEVETYQVRQALKAGDVALIARDSAFMLRDDWSSPVKDIRELISREHIETLRGLSGGGGGAPTTFLCGPIVTEDDEDCPLLGSLPPVIVTNGGDAAPWLESLLKLVASELSSVQPGSQSVLNHLVQVMFVQAVRAYTTTTQAGLAQETTPGGNLFKAMSDADIAPVLGLMHSRPEEPWTVAQLAERANFGRSAFAARFTAIVGIPPLQYLTEYRMRKAKAMLRETDFGVKCIATKVGYSNESAFSHAFKRTTGMSPGAYRHKKTTDKKEDPSIEGEGSA